MSDDACPPSERTVLGHLDEDALVECLVELVRIPSMGGSDAEIEVQEASPRCCATSTPTSTGGTSTSTR